MSVEGGVCKAFAIILSKELAVAQADVVDLVARATSIHPLPLFWRLLSFSAPIQRKYKPVSEADALEFLKYSHANQAKLSNLKGALSLLFHLILNELCL